MPDYSDIEDEEDYDPSDMEKIEQPSSEDGISMESQSLKSSRAISAIDLTRDDSPVASPAHVDLTGETPAEKKIMGLMASHPDDIDGNADPVSIPLYAGNNPILVDSDDEGDETHFSSESDDQSDEAGGSNDSESSDICDMDSDAASETVEANKNRPMEGAVEGANGICLSNTERFALATHEKRPVLLSDLRARIEASDNIMDDDDAQSDFGLSEAGAEGIRALFEDGLLESHKDYPFFEEDANESTSTGPFDGTRGIELNGSPKNISFASLPSEQAPDTASGASLYQNSAIADCAPVEGMASQIGDLQYRGPQSFATIRRPSPSDVVMVKTAGATTSNSVRVAVTNPVQAQNLMGQDWRQRTAQYLGDKTGKHAFFAARELNKAHIHGAENQAGVPGQFDTRCSTDQALEIGNQDESQGIKRQRKCMEKTRLDSKYQASFSNANEIDLEQSAGSYRPSHSTAINAVDFGKFLGFSGYANLLTKQALPPLTTSAFLDDPSQVPVLQRAASPLLDMTSAVKYNESKASMAALISNSAPPQSVRSGLRIDDIIEEPSLVEKSKDLKRKANEISDIIENESHIWASTEVEVPGRAADLSVLESQVVAGGEASELTQFTKPDASEHHPAKRLKKFVEVAGYLALGGAAVGAGMFSLLVATAPDFM